jgi:hypothetical protein
VGNHVFWSEAGYQPSGTRGRADGWGLDLRQPSRRRLTIRAGLAISILLSGCGSPYSTRQATPTEQPVSQAARRSAEPIEEAATSTTSPTVVLSPHVTAVQVATANFTVADEVTESPLPDATPAAAMLPETTGMALGTDWINDPAIVVIRRVYQEVRQGLQDGSLTTRERELDYCVPYQDTKRVIATDEQGRVRMYRREAGSEDSSLAWEHYYDDQERLRFVFISGGAVNGSVLEHRIYFDEEQRRIKEVQTYTEGPGYTFPTTWPIEELQLADPAAAFAAQPPPCN